MRLVFVEGLPGAGKSTTAQWLALEHARQGVPCRWIYEQQPDHPVSHRALVARRGVTAFETVLRGFEGLDFAERTGLRGLDLLLAYWKAHHEVLEAAVETLGLPTLVVDQRTGDWPEWRARIAAFVGLARPAPPVPWPDNRLLHKSGDVFRAEAWPYEVIFPVAGGSHLVVNLDV